MVLDWHILLIHSLLFYLPDMVILLVNTEAMLTTGESMLNTEIYLYRQSSQKAFDSKGFYHHGNRIDSHMYIYSL